VAFQARNHTDVGVRPSPISATILRVYLSGLVRDERTVANFAIRVLHVLGERNLALQ